MTYQDDHDPMDAILAGLSLELIRSQEFVVETTRNGDVLRLDARNLRTGAHLVARSDSADLLDAACDLARQIEGPVRN